jgi:hypothetical protein
LISALVAIGYQVQQFILNSASFGSCQSQKRMIVSITAPSLNPIKEPPHTHFMETKQDYSLGKTASRDPISITRNALPTPFPGVTVEDAYSDLPNISQGLLRSILYPEHKVLGAYNFYNMIRCQAVSSADMYLGVNIVKKSILALAKLAGLLNSYQSSI